MMNVAIIGGGASGVIAALRLKFNNPAIDVTIYEKNNKLLKKVATTGNGRCNLSNQNIDGSKYLNPVIIDEMLDLGYRDSMLDFFHELGLFTTTDEEGRVYPKSNQAQTVVELLTKELFYKKVKVNLNTNVDNVIRKDGMYLVDGAMYDKVIICVGSNASVSKEEIPLLKNLGLSYTPFKPALVGFKVKEDISNLFGVRASATVSLNGKTSKGEVMFKEDGVSGICVMDLSVFSHSGTLSFDFLDDYPMEILKMIVARKLNSDPYVHLHNLLFGSVNNKLLGMFNKGYPNVKVSTLERDVLDSYLRQFKEFKLTITDTYPILNAHVGSGGISLDELDVFESRKYCNLYIAGEATNQVGLCGGFNLWYAFTSGIMVADKICK